MTYGTLFATVIAAMSCGGCIAGAVPERTQLAVLSMESLQREILAMHDASKIDSGIDALHQKMRLAERNNPGKVDMLWLQGLNLHDAIYRKARKGWPGLIMNPMWAENIGLAGGTAEEVVISRVYQSAAVAASLSQNPRAQDYRHWFLVNVPHDPWLKQQWMRYAERFGVLGDKRSGVDPTENDGDPGLVNPIE